MSYFVATETFTDPTNGTVIQGGTTYQMAADCDVLRMYPQRFKPLERSAYVPGITRVGGVASLAGSSVSRPRPRRAKASERQREFTYKDTELVERYADFTIDLGSSARKTITDEIWRVQRDIGEVEVGGWLFGQYLPRAESTSTTIAFVSGPLPGSRASSRTLEIGDPREALALARSGGLGEIWQVIGDWHAHTCRGSELPSMQDARAWAGTMDSLGREAYISLIVSPSSEMGWQVPKFSAWIAGRDYTRGQPSRPIVARARLAW